MIKLNFKGETIVEVMFAIAVAASALAGSYYIANRSGQQTRAAAERIEALKAAESKAEILRTVPKNSLDIAPADFCLTDVGEVKNTGTDFCKVGALYNVTIKKLSTTPISYEIKATWDSLLGGTENVTIYYRP